MSGKAIGELRLETQLLARRLMEVKEGETIPYLELNTTGGIDVQEDGRGLLATARKHAEQELKCLFSPVWGVGLKRLPPDESHAETGRATDHIRRTAKRALIRSGRVDWNRMSSEARASMNIERTILHVSARVSTDKSRKRIAAAVGESGNILPFDKTLEHFGSK